MKIFLPSLVLGLFVIHYCAYAQNKRINERPTIAILPFNYNASVKNADASSLGQKVESAFINSKRFDVIERTNFPQIYQELEAQKDEAYLSSTKLADQGRLIGASQIVVGNVTSSGNQGTTFNIKVVDISTGQVIGAKDISDRGKREAADGIVSLAGALLSNKNDNKKDIIEKTDDAGAADVVGHALLNINKEIQDFINDHYALTYDILEVSQAKGNLAKEILIVGSVAEGLKKNVRLEIINETEKNFNDRVLKQKSVIGEVMVMAVEGDIATCRVSKGGKDLSDLLNSANNVYVSTIIKK